MSAGWGQSIELPQVCITEDSTITVPIFIYDISNLESIDLTIEYDEGIVLAEGIIENPLGILVDSYTFYTNLIEPGIIRLAIVANSDNLFSGSGMIAQIIFQSIGNIGEVSSLTFLDAIINGSVELDSSVDGSIEIGCSNCTASDGTPGVELWGECYSIENTTVLDLFYQQLTGSIPSEIELLTNLTVLNLNSNQLTGEIPPEIGNLTNLTSLALRSNALTGEIPPEIGNLTNLIHLDLHSNQLTGEIPPEIGNLTNLTSLALRSNALTGEIPEEIEQLMNLTTLGLSSNQLTGEIPEEIGQLMNLTTLGLSSNQLTGEIPLEIWNLTNLTNLNLGYNNLTGEIPEEIGQLTNLIFLSLEINQFSGVIPSTIGNLTNLTSLYLRANEFTGDIPSEIGNLTNLTDLILDQNQFTSIPNSIGELNELNAISLSFNQLTSIPNSIGSLNNLDILDLFYNQLYCEYGQQNPDIIPDFLTDGSIEWVLGLYFQDCCSEGGLEPSDCAGECGGEAELDECGVCGGDGSTCLDIECDYAACMNITNVNIDAGTLDIHMTNQAGCAYCVGGSWGAANEYVCAETGGIWTYDQTMDAVTCAGECSDGASTDEASCEVFGGTWTDAENNGIYFNGAVGGFQFYIEGITITGVSGGTAEEYLDFVDFNASTGKTLGASFFGTVIPEGSGVLTTISFSDAEDGICFAENECSLQGACSNAIASGGLFTFDVYSDWGECYTPSECDVALGDVNDDGDISILDLVQISYYILDLSIPDYECAADYNQDGSVDILDLVAIVNIILFDE